MNFSVIVPTCGRETLMRTLASIRNAGIDPLDEVLVVGDGPQPNAEEMCRSFHSDEMPVIYIDGPESHCYGNAQRNFGMGAASKDVLLFMDDDDEYVPDILPEIRKVVLAAPGKVIIGRMMHRTIGLIWKDPHIRLGNVGSQMLVVPNCKHYLGHWPDVYEGDYEFIRLTVEKWPGGAAGVVWMDRVFAIHHPRPEDPTAV